MPESSNSTIIQRRGKKVQQAIDRARLSESALVLFRDENATIQGARLSAKAVTLVAAFKNGTN